MGTYEIQYSRWTGATNDTWTTATNWDESVDPSSGTGDVVIPTVATFYPTNSAAPDFTVGVNKTMILFAGAKATLGTITNNGILRLESNSTGIASLKIDGYGDNGTEEIQLYLEGNSNGTMWHYISPPVTTLASTTFSSNGAAVAEYREGLIDNDMNNGWVTSLGYHYDPGTGLWDLLGFPSELPWSSLYAGSGYNYYSTSNKTFNITGTINTSDVVVDLFYNSGGGGASPNENGWNLIGNPFTSSIDWDLVVDDASNSSVWSSAEATIYFRKNGVTYLYNYGSGETLPNDFNIDAGNLVPPMQGFFVKTGANVTLTIPAAAKVHSASKRYKGGTIIPKIRLQLENSGMSDQTLFWFSDKGNIVIR